MTSWHYFSSETSTQLKVFHWFLRIVCGATGSGALHFGAQACVFRQANPVQPAAAADLARFAVREFVTAFSNRWSRFPSDRLARLFGTQARFLLAVNVS